MRTRRALAGLVLALWLSLTSVGAPAPSQPAPASQPSIPAYQLAPDDKIKITVYGEEQLSGDFVVGSDGNLSFPLIGMVSAGGLTLAQLQAEITRQLDTSYVSDPKVTVEIAEYRPFYILGEVSKPGQYPYRVGLTIHAAVATAGGFTYRANKKTLAIQRRGESGEAREKITPDLQVRPGDTIRILERFF